MEPTIRVLFNSHLLESFFQIPGEGPQEYSQGIRFLYKLSKILPLRDVSGMSSQDKVQHVLGPGDGLQHAGGTMTQASPRGATEGIWGEGSWRVSDEAAAPRPGPE